jgi:transposase
MRIDAHVDALTFLGGVPEALVCDNLKAGVTAASRYELGVNLIHQDLAAHYGTIIMPAWPRKPRDKAKVEAAVLIVQRWVLARLRNRRFFSLAELNVPSASWSTNSMPGSIGAPISCIIRQQSLKAEPPPQQH